MCLSDVGLISILLLTLLSIRNDKLVKYIPHITAISAILIFGNAEIHWNYNYFSYQSKYNVVRFCITLVGALLLYTNTLLKQRIIIILMLIGSMLLLSSCDIFSLIFTMELMAILSYFWVYISQNNLFKEANYFKYNVLASMLLLLSMSILLKTISAGSFEEIRFILSFGNGQNRFALLIVLTLIAAFSIRIGVFFPYLDKIPLSKLSLIFCVLIPVNSLKINELMSEVFCSLDTDNILRCIGCITILYASFLFYTSKKISDLLTSNIIYHAGIVNLCCAMKTPNSSMGLLFLCLSELFTMAGIITLLIAVRKKFDKQLEEISDLFAFGFRHKKIGTAISCLFLCIMCFPPSLNFFGVFYVSLELAKANYLIDFALFFVSLTPIIAKCIKIVSKIWEENTSAFFSVVNVKLINIVYVIIMMYIIVFPSIYGLSKFFGVYYVTL